MNKANQYNKLFKLFILTIAILFIITSISGCVIKDKSEATTDDKAVNTKKELTKDNAIQTVESMIKNMHIAILNYGNISSGSMRADHFWKLIFDHVYHDTDIKEQSGDEEGFSVYKQVTEEDIMDITLIYGLKYDKLPSIPSDYSNLISHIKKDKAYKFNVNSDAEHFVYEVVEYEVQQDNSIKVIIGYIPFYEEEYEAYEDVYEVVLKDMQSDKEEFFYYVDSVKSTDKEYKLVDREDKSKVN